MVGIKFLPEIILTGFYWK